MRTRIGLISFCVLVLYAAINFSWSHAAIAGVWSNGTCADATTKQASDRVGAFYGDVTAAPWMLCLDAPVLGLDVPYGTTRFAPLLPAIVVLGPNGQTVDVAAHELAHAELAQRTSVLLRSYRFPTWFDEGLAMQLDHRPAYQRDALADVLSDLNITTFDLDAIASPRQFFGQGLRSRMHYALAKCVVERAISEKGKQHVLGLVDQVWWTRPFPASAFDVYVPECMSE